MSKTIHVAIGNSDDRLTQAEWAAYRAEVDETIRGYVKRSGGTVHGAWVSPSADPFQNACWAFTLGDEGLSTFAATVSLRLVAEKYRQHSIAWNASETQFLLGAEA